MSEFKREYKYMVLKATDIEGALNDEQKRLLDYLGSLITKHRTEKGKAPMECVVVEHDWPEYEPTWAAIEARVVAN